MINQIFCYIEFTKLQNICYKTYFLQKIFGWYTKKQYLCTVFFMVLDLRLSKRLGCRDDNPSFFLLKRYLHYKNLGVKKSA